MEGWLVENISLDMTKADNTSNDIQLMEFRSSQQYLILRNFWNRTPVHHYIFEIHFVTQPVEKWNLYSVWLHILCGSENWQFKYAFYI